MTTNPYELKSKSDKQLIEESIAIISKIFGKGKDDGLNEYKRMSIYNVYKKRYIEGGLQMHHYEEIIEKMKPFILANKDLNSLEGILLNAVEAYRKQKWQAVFTKLEAYRKS